MKVAIFGSRALWAAALLRSSAANGHTALMYASSIASAQRHKEQLDASLQKRVAKGKSPRVPRMP